MRPVECCLIHTTSFASICVNGSAKLAFELWDSMLGFGIAVFAFWLIDSMRRDRYANYDYDYDYIMPSLPASPSFLVIRTLVPLHCLLLLLVVLAPCSCC